MSRGGAACNQSVHRCVLAQAPHVKQENGRKMHRAASLQRMASAEHTPKKACHSRVGRQDALAKGEAEAAAS